MNAAGGSADMSGSRAQRREALPHYVPIKIFCHPAAVGPLVDCLPFSTLDPITQGVRKPGLTICLHYPLPSVVDPLKSTGHIITYGIRQLVPGHVF
jgi:hypothetical protein